MTRPTVCLTMIVKNEAHVIRRCLQSALPFIDAWCVVDTGSTDGTQEIVRSFLKHVPGELHERPWRNFGANRTEAIRLAEKSAEYLLFLDADEEFEAPDRYSFPNLTADSYTIMLRLADISYWRIHLVATRLKWRFEGVLHEYLACDKQYGSEKLVGPTVISKGDGGRSQAIDVVEKYRRDAAVLEEALKTEPDNRRYVFYLAQSYRDSNQLEKSLAAYRRRAEMGGWDEEVWYSLREAASLSASLDLPHEIVVERFLHAYQYRPRRAEPLVYLAAYHRGRSEFALARLYAKAALEIPPTDDILFIDESCYTWRGKDEYAIASYYCGDFEGSKRANEELLASSTLPDGERDRVRANLDFAVKALSGGSAGHTGTE